MNEIDEIPDSNEGGDKETYGVWLLGIHSLCSCVLRIARLGG